MNDLMQMLPALLPLFVPFLTRLLIPVFARLSPTVRGLINIVLGVLTAAVTGEAIGADPVQAAPEGMTALLTHSALHLDAVPKRK